MNTTISISKDTRDMLREFGKKSESYDDVIKRMLSTIELRLKMQEFVNKKEYSTLKEAEEWTRLKISELKD